MHRPQSSSSLFVRRGRSLMVLVGTLFALKMGLAERPNIVLLYADDMGYGDLAIQNPESKIPTPYLDQLAREGMRFTDAHSSSGICTPSRYALLTGRYHWRDFHDIVQSWGDSVFKDEQVTLPEMLKQKGYHTACIGKWHLGWNWKALEKPGVERVKVRNKETYPPDGLNWSLPIPNGPLNHGFDYYFGDDVPNFPPYTWIENDRVVTAPTLPLSETPKTAEGNWEARPGPMAQGWSLEAVMPRLTERTVTWIGEQKKSDRPFFLYMPWTSPHAPIVPTNAFKGSSEAGGYGDFMTQSDWTAGQVLKALDENGFRDNTLVIFTSDNGPEKYAFERTRKFGHYSSGPLRGLKRDIWEGGHRVPFVVRWPGKIEAGSVNHSLISQVDLVATIASIIDAKPDRQTAIDSIDFSAVWEGSQYGPSPRRNHVHNTRSDHYAIREGDWVLIDAETGSVTKSPAWYDESNQYLKNADTAALYHLKSDLGQRNNLIAKNPEKAEALRQLLKQIQLGNAPL